MSGLNSQLSSLLGKDLAPCLPSFTTQQSPALAAPQKKQEPAKKTSAISTENLQALSKDLQGALTKDWGIGTVGPRLTTDEIRFLRTVTVEQLKSGSFQNQANPVLQFCLQIVQGVLSHYITSAIMQSISSPETPTKSVKPTESPSRSTESHAAAKAGERNPASTKVKASIVDTAKISAEPSQKATPGMDPSLKKAAEITFDEGKKLPATYLKDEIKAWAKTLSPEDQKFFESSTKVIGAAVKSGQFATKAAEIGFNGAVAETVKDALIDYAAKATAKGFNALTAPTNPVFWGKFFSYAFSSFLDPTETAPPSSDMRFPPLPPLSNDPFGPKMPHLNPSLPSLKQGK